MAIKKAELKKMNEMLTNGSTVAQIQREFDKYEYWEIYWETNDYSFLGKKRMITNRIKKVSRSKSPSKKIKKPMKLKYS